METMRIIDADKLNIYDISPVDGFVVMGVTEEDIALAPSIDIVTCYMCKYSHITYDGQCKYCDQITDDDGNVIEVYFDGSHFCSDGEREGE